MLRLLEETIDAECSMRWQSAFPTNAHSVARVIADLALFAAFAITPLLLFYSLRTNKANLWRSSLVWLIACLLATSAVTHLVDALRHFQPWRELNEAFKVISALAAWTGVVTLARILPRALHFPEHSLDHSQSIRDLEERYELEAALRRSEEGYALAVRGTNDGIWDWHVSTGEFRGSDRFWELMGMTSERFDHFDHFFQAFKRCVHPDDLELVERALEAHFEAKSDYEVEFRLCSSEGQVRWFLARGRVFRDENDVPKRMAGSLTDVTARKNAEAERERLLGELRALNAELEARVAERTHELTNSLKERELLLREMHHRVKNNLQVISSLLRMQARQVEHTPSRSALDECQSRVEAIALIHEQLYRATNFASMPFSDYANNLAHAVLRATDTSPSKIRLDIEATDVTLPLDEAIPCGLILNELMTNAFKHAFPNQRQGTVKVRLVRDPSGQVELSVSDDGVGLGLDFHEKRSTSLGVKLVLTLVEQLDGRLEIRQQGGTCFSVCFPSRWHPDLKGRSAKALSIQA